eukprot:s2051_g9.t1
MATESGAAASAATTTAEKEGSLWNILPGFDPQQDDPREYRDKVQFLHGICPKKDRTMLAPRLAMLMKGTAWAQVKQIEPASLTDPDTGVKALLQAISTWEETEEMQLYDKFEKALYRTTQRTDETTQSFVNRLAVSFHELGTLTVKDIKAFIVLRQSALGVEDKKRVLTMAGTPMTQDGVEKAMRQLSTKVLVGQAEGRKKVYPVNFVEEEEEINMVQEHETMDEEQAIILLAEQGDDDAQLIKEFEDQLIEVCQENQDLAMCYTSYAEARTKIRERLRQKGKSKGGKKGGKGDFGRFHSKKASLAERIAASHCRRCGAKGHWKWECPAKDGNKEDVNVVTAVDVTENDPEIYGELPEGVRESSTIEELFEMMAEKDCPGSTCPPPGIGFNSSVNGTMGYSVNLDNPLPFPEDPSLTYMTVTVDEEVKRPPGVHSLRQWGQMVMGEGKHKSLTFLEVIHKDRGYADWMKKHQRLSSDWALSFQNFVKAWDQTHGQSQSVQVTPKAKALAPSRKEPPRSVWSEDEEELVMIEQGTTVPKTSREGNSMSSGKRGIGSEDVDKMQAEVNPQLVQQLQLQIAMLQDQLARVTKNTEK